MRMQVAEFDVKELLVRGRANLDKTYEELTAHDHAVLSTSFKFTEAIIQTKADSPPIDQEDFALWMKSLREESRVRVEEDDTHIYCVIVIHHPGEEPHGFGSKVNKTPIGEGIDRTWDSWTAQLSEIYTAGGGCVQAE